MLWVVLVSLVPAGASADAIDMPPTDCPVGSVGVTSHAGAWCDATTCSEDASCIAYRSTLQGPMSYTCEPSVGLCVVRESYTEGGLRGATSPAPTRTRDVAGRSCTSDADCSAPASCVIASRCVPMPHPVTGVLVHACGCRAAGTGDRASGLVAASCALGVALGLRRRRLSRPSRALPAARGGASSPSP